MIKRHARASLLLGIPSIFWITVAAVVFSIFL